MHIVETAVCRYFGERVSRCSTTLGRSWQYLQVPDRSSQLQCRCVKGRRHSFADRHCHSAPTLRKRTDQNRPYALMVVNAYLHKNTIAACRALTHSSAVYRGVSLCVVGSIAPEARAICEKAGLVVEFHADVDDAALADLYAHALFSVQSELGGRAQPTYCRGAELWRQCAMHGYTCSQGVLRWSCSILRPI